MLEKASLFGMGSSSTGGGKWSNLDFKVVMVVLIRNCFEWRIEPNFKSNREILNKSYVCN